MNGRWLRVALAALPAVLFVDPVLAQAPPAPAPAPAPPSAPAPAPASPDTPDKSPITIDQALQLALTRNERAAIADQQVAVADAAVQAAYVKFQPTLVVNATDQQTPYKITSGTPPDVVTTSNIGTASATFTQPLLNAGAFPLLRQAERLLDAQRATSDDAKRQLAYDAATAFLTSLSVQKVLDAAGRRKSFADDDLDNSKKLFAAGIQGHGQNDVTRALLEQASAAQDLATSQGNVQRAYLDLSYVLNAPVTGSLTDPTSLLQAAGAPLARPEQLIAVAERTRLDLISARHSARAAHLFADEPMLRTVPVVSLVGNISGASNTPAASRATSEFLELTFSWTLYDAGQRYADKHSRDAQAAIADLTEHTLVRTVANDVLEALNTLNSGRAQLAAATDAFQQSKDNYNQTDQLYNTGLSTKLDQTTALDSLFETESSYYETQLAVELSYLALRQAMGLQPLGTELL